MVCFGLFVRRWCGGILCMKDASGQRSLANKTVMFLVERLSCLKPQGRNRSCCPSPPPQNAASRSKCWGKSSADVVHSSCFSQSGFVSSFTMQQGNCKSCVGATPADSNAFHFFPASSFKAFARHLLKKKRAAASAAIHLLVSSFSAQSSSGTTRHQGGTHEVVRQGETKPMRQRTHLCGTPGGLVDWSLMTWLLWKQMDTW